MARITLENARTLDAACERIITPSHDRTDPFCTHFARCGGCSLQHMNYAAQLEEKQRHLAQAFAQHGGLAPKTWLAPISGDSKGYRSRARLAVLRHRDGSGRGIGFRQRRSERVELIELCPVLAPELQQLLAPLNEIIRGLERSECPNEIRIAVDDKGDLGILFDGLINQAALGQRLERLANVAVVVFRSPAGESIFARGSALDLWLEPADGLNMRYTPGDFVQANNQINKRMVDQVVQRLDLTENESVLDLFCGLGNFTIALAKRCREVTGIDLGLKLIESARVNASLNQLENVRFESSDLTQDPGPQRWARAQYDAVLLDPPRAGAAGVLPTIARTKAHKIAYVSCYPGTMARDIRSLRDDYGYELEAAGIVDQFPQSHHVECVAFLSGEPRLYK